MHPGPIIQLVMNDVVGDARVRRCALTLRDAGYDVIYVGLSYQAGHNGTGFATAEPLDDLPRYLMHLPMQHPLAPLVADGARGTRAAWSLRALACMRSVLSMSPALIHAHDLMAFRFVAHMAAARGVPTLYDSHELETGDYHPTWGPVRRWLHGLSERLVIGRAARVITVAPSIADALAQAYPIARPMVLVNSHPRAHIRPNRPLRARLGLSPDARVIVFTGTRTAGRGLEALLRALPKLPSNIHVACVGRTQVDFEPRWRVLLSELGSARDRVHVLPPVPYEDVIHTIWGADVGFNGIDAIGESLRHALPNKFFESAFAAIPILSTPGISVSRLVEDYQLGRLSSLSEADLVANLSAMTAEPNPSSEGPGRDRFIAKYCWESQAARLRGLYQALLPPGT